MNNFIRSSKFIGPISTILVSIILYKIIKSIISKSLLKRAEHDKNNKVITVIKLLTNVIRYLMIFVAIMIILYFLGVDIKALLTSFGVLGVVVGLAFQDLLKDLISGVFIIVENQYFVGDLIQVDGFTGTVTEIGLKSTRIRNIDGNVLIIPNRLVDKVINYSQTNSFVNLKVPVDLDNNAVLIREVVENFVKNIKGVPGLIGDVTFLGLSSIADKLEIYIKCEVEAPLLWNAERYLNEELLKELQLHNIKYKEEKLSIYERV